MEERGGKGRPGEHQDRHEKAGDHRQRERRAHVVVGQVLALDHCGAETSLGEELTERNDDDRRANQPVVGLGQITSKDDDHQELTEALRTEPEA